jgi:4-hydroxybenzoate polyprenyltransferase
MHLKRFREYLKLGRMHSAVLMGLAPVCVAAATGYNISLYHYISLFLIGLLFHIYSFVLNEVQDLKIDKTSKNLETKPLVGGLISLKSARAIVFSSATLVIILSIVLFPQKTFILIPVSLLAFALGAIYDTYGKKIPHADYFLATMIFLVALYGGFSVKINIGTLSYIIALLAMSQALINNIIAGLKDVDHDFIASGLSTPLRLKVKLKGELFFVSIRFIIYICVLKIVHIFLTIYPFVYHKVVYESWQFYLVIFLIFLALIFMIRFLTFKKFKREKIIRAIGFHEIFAFMVIPFILLGIIGPIAAIFLVFFPIVWLGIFLIIIYGRLMPII